MLVSFVKPYSYKPMELKLRIASTRNPELPPYTKTYVVATNQKSHATTNAYRRRCTRNGAAGRDRTPQPEPLNNGPLANAIGSTIT
ncbi:hypothetical protein P8452_34652 [Trifolium repens]|jgi:hypothetical protein|nr:hypothetical protein P8452_34652 [Trifolium repens]